MTSHVLKGPFLTRAEAAKRGEVSTELITHRPDLLRLGGKWLQEVYFAFQFDPGGVRPGLGMVVQTLKGEYADQAIAEWLALPHPELGFASPLDFLNAGGTVERVLVAATDEGPTAPPRAAQVPAPPSRGPEDHSSRGAVPGKRAGRHLTRRPLFGN